MLGYTGKYSATSAAFRPGVMNKQRDAYLKSRFQRKALPGCYQQPPPEIVLQDGAYLNCILLRSCTAGHLCAELCVGLPNEILITFVLTVTLPIAGVGVALNAHKHSHTHPKYN